ncbi:SDR family oxidoreductase [Legionella waltersii]|uniref:Short chain dehydrogenase/reductase family oxidoreductase n=1 Tax=Legionella waltersii TaxID=66969 RepID=A0A0W1ADJ9_9GAMM|nr:SDR family oxidoreductase [Legionella waltersii]KTD79418.1 short chain dehydrogenase/reductase family oxidoreductase [Legionella waltersii]SNU97758.1 retinol dehydrogenase [Legionella waltersii]
MKKVIVVTGTSSGLGLSLVIKLAREGHCVYATMRNLAKQDALASAAREAAVTIHIKQLDVQSTLSVEKCMSEIINEQGKIDCLINNAGMGFIKTTEQATEEEIQRIMNTNFMGVVRCVKSVLPYMRKARQGHIINVSSVGGLVGQPLNEIYCASKFAIEGYTESMATYIQPTFNVKFTLVEPGGIASEFANNLLAEFEATKPTEADEYTPILQKYLHGAKERLASGHVGSIYQKSSEVADCIVDVVNSKKPPLRIRSSDWANDFCHMKTLGDPDGTLLAKKIHDMFL